MSSTIYAAFADPADAERAAGALLDHGLHNDEISLVANEAYNQSRRAVSSSTTDPVEPSHYNPGVSQEVENSEVLGTSYGHAVVSDTGRPAVQPQTWGVPGSNMAYGAQMAGGTESTDEITHYPRGEEAFETDDGSPVESTLREPSSASTREPLDESTPVIDRPEIGAKSGISTTTAADAGAGAIKGAAVGLGVGVLAMLASLFVPGVGLVMGAGALATALGGMVGATGAGVIAGGVVGYLKDQGVPEEAVTVYHNAFDQGGAILAVAVPAEYNRADIEGILAKYGATNVEMYGQVRSV